MSKLFWKDLTPKETLVLADLRTGHIKGRVSRVANSWSVYACDWYPWNFRGNNFADLHHAKQYTEAYVKSYLPDDLVIMEEVELLVEIYERALRQILANRDLEEAHRIAREALADPSKFDKK